MSAPSSNNAPISVGTHEQATMAKVIGRRLREAREMCGLSQIEAARRLEMGNSTLSKAEGGTRSDGGDAVTVSVDLIYRAAKVYEVSADFLFGRSDEWDTAEPMLREREVSAWLFDTWAKERQRDMSVVRKLHVRFDEVDVATRAMLEAVSEIDAAMTRVRELNPGWDDDIVAGSRLLMAIHSAAKAAKASLLRIDAFRAECREKASGGASLGSSITAPRSARPAPGKQYAAACAVCDGQ